MATTNSKLADIGNPVWFITGCSTGFGRELAKHVIECGYRALVTARDLFDVKDLAANKDALALKLDVTDQSQIDAAILNCKGYRVTESTTPSSSRQRCLEAAANKRQELRKEFSALEMLSRM